MTTIMVLADGNNILAEELVATLRQSKATHQYQFLDISNCQNLGEAIEPGTCCVYVPSLVGRHGMAPSLAEAEQVFQQAAQLKSGKFLLISSALVYGTGCGRQGLATEDYSVFHNGSSAICSRWNSLETLARRSVNGSVPLTILRPVTVLPSPAWLSQVLQRRFVPTLPGHDPTLQLLSISDLAEAVNCAARQDKPGTFNVAPDGVVPFHAAIRLTDSYRLPIPRTLQRLSKGKDALEYLRFPWTISNAKIKKELGFVPQKSSVTALLEQKSNGPHNGMPEPRFDEFGMDEDYIKFYGKTLFKFLCDFYWRIEVNGLEHVPVQGPGIMVGTHRGFMPFDGVMTLHVLAKKTGRLVRFLVHPGLFKFPFLANFMTKLGGVLASQESSDRVLQAGELVGLFPEGIKGAFTPYRKAYTLQGFGRDAFVKLALRNRAPIVPFLIVGSAEIFPILGKIKSTTWTKYSEWPYIPITPTFPLLPVPLPSKWHIQFLPAIHVEQQYPPEAAGDRAIVKAISLEVRARMQEAWDKLLSRRRAIFWGSIFDGRPDHET